MQQMSDDPNLYVIRYEDLSRDFTTVMTGLLKWLGVSCSAADVARIAEATSFERKAGRSRGETAKNILRKGQILEWVDTLSLLDKLVAWMIARRQLAWLGYRSFSGIREFHFRGKGN